MAKTLLNDSALVVKGVYKDMPLNIKWAINEPDNFDFETHKRETLLGRVLSANKTPKKNLTNSIGTSLYIVGLVDSDDYIDPSKNYSSLRDKLEKVDKPRVGAIIAKEHYDSSKSGSCTYITHMGVVTIDSPLKITGRKEGPKHSLKVDSDPSTLGFNLEKDKDILQYYIVKKE